MVHAQCYYVNAAPDVFGNPLWQVTDFTIWLTKQQPTHWQASVGRFVNPVDNTLCIQDGRYIPDTDCDGAGIDPGAIPPTAEGFQGELKCVEVDVAGNPIGGNHLKGEATIITPMTMSPAQRDRHPGHGLAGETGPQLLLNQPLEADGGDPVGQYNACPNALLLNHLADGVTDRSCLRTAWAAPAPSAALPATRTPTAAPASATTRHRFSTRPTRWILSAPRSLT